MSLIETTAQTLKKLDINLLNNSLLSSYYINNVLERLGARRKNCLFMYQNTFSLVELTLKIDTAAVKTDLIGDFIQYQNKSLVFLDLNITKDVGISDFQTRKVLT